MIHLNDIVAIARGKRAISIDGLPVSGKSTLAEALESELGAVCLYLDDFIIPDPLWPRPLRPDYPFPYIRHADFLATAAALVTTRTCSFQPFDWSTYQLAAPRTLEAHDRPVIIEGVSALDPALATLYDLRLWVESDRTTTLAAAKARGVGPWAMEWQDYFMPSVDLYMRTNPRERADLIIAGRGA